MARDYKNNYSYVSSENWEHYNNVLASNYQFSKTDQCKWLDPFDYNVSIFELGSEHPYWDFAVTIDMLKRDLRLLILMDNINNAPSDFAIGLLTGNQKGKHGNLLEIEKNFKETQNRCEKHGYDYEMMLECVKNNVFSYV